ncbi:MAG: FAD-binding oxidoreductase [Candidatus Aminicenantes bacterium]|nr:FAD-binding oxidoreductase [Candidatus Aminicenantes bacterium]
MRRWNGWGSDAVDFPVPPAAQAYLAEAIGPAEPGPSAEFEKVIRRVPASRLPDHPQINRDPDVRLRHARGHSLPDWISLRYGTVESFPDGMSRPASEEDVEKIIALASKAGACLIPYGGGTSVVGHVNPAGPNARPVLTVSLERMRRMSALDERSRLAVFEAGVSGPHLEAQLRARGFTLGHFPQSFEYSTLGGWVATRSSGQQSLYYGRIEELFAGGRLVAPAGKLDMPPFPASAAGPDLREAVLGSEGRLGILTRAVVRISPLPESERFYGLFFPDWSLGVTAVKTMAQERLPLSMLRLSDSVETETSLALVGNERLVRLLNGLLRVRGFKEEKCLLFMGTTGNEAQSKRTRRWALDIARSHNAVHVGRKMGSEWRKSRFKTPYLRNTLWDLGYAVDTLETALAWADLVPAAEAILRALRDGLEDKGERVLAFAHVSHVYPTGASIYVTFIFRLAKTAEETMDRWRRLKTAATRVIVAHGGTISHQHGVGLDHRPWLENEKGRLGLKSLEAMARTFDPEGIMNPGKLFGHEGMP